MKKESITAPYWEIMKSEVFRTDGKPIDLPDALARLGNAINETDTSGEEYDFIWDSLGEHTEAPLGDLIVGAYWSLSEWHGGQSSPEYAALCALGEVFKPGCTGPPSPEESEWTAYMLTCQHFGGYVLFEPSAPEEGDEWWQDLPSARAGFLVVKENGDDETVDIPCTTCDEAAERMAAFKNTHLCGVWKAPKP